MADTDGTEIQFPENEKNDGPISRQNAGDPDSNCSFPELEKFLENYLKNPNG